MYNYDVDLSSNITLYSICKYHEKLSRLQISILVNEVISQCLMFWLYCFMNNAQVFILDIEYQFVHDRQKIQDMMSFGTRHDTTMNLCF